ncbi:hypothetical protein BV20DRAFT_709420 [Pilatotrama ljubarskyi]|nr:hypothetical protein BV20DRAFT_709420 [Pilatotrama ljubarskyi]
MPGHHRVRFADITSTPSSTFSDATLASSPGPATPPALKQSPLPAKHRSAFSPAYYPTSPLPAAPVQIHPILACATGYATPLTWDVSQFVESVLVRASNGTVRPLSDQVVKEPATTPKVASITIISEQLPWAITVHPKSDAHWAAPYVTVGDVLYTLYRTLRLGVTTAEQLLCDSAHYQRVHDAYVARCERIAHPGDRAEEKSKGVKRVDFLLQARMFKGLSLVPEGIPAKGLAPGVVWQLHVARP